MCPYVKIAGFDIPGYSVMIILGLVLANIIGFYYRRNDKNTDANDLIICEAYTGLGAILGSKILYLWVSRNLIDWSRIFEMEYFNSLMKGGFVFYGGLIGGLIFFALGCCIHKIDGRYYINKFLFLIPFIHGFGRVGCFMAGCCYGVRYDGIFSVRFPENSYAPAGIGLFPVQLAEAVLLFAISALLFYISKKGKKVVSVYFIVYGVERFIIEFFRFDEARGMWLWFSTSQWISIAFVVTGILIWLWGKKHKNNLSFNKKL